MIPVVWVLWLVVGSTGLQLPDKFHSLKECEIALRDNQATVILGNAMNPGHLKLICTHETGSSGD